MTASTKSVKHRPPDFVAIEDIQAKTVHQFYDWYDAQKSRPTHAQVRAWFTSKLTDNIAEYNGTQTNKYYQHTVRVNRIPAACLADIIIHCEIMKFITLADDSVLGDTDAAVLGYYVSSGKDEGIYKIKEMDIRRLIRAYSPSINPRERLEVIDALIDKADSVAVTKNPNLSPVANGVYNKTTGKLEPFSPDYVFLHKLQTKYNPDAENVFITMPDGEVWDCESQLLSFGTDAGFQKILRDTMTATVYPYQEWGKAVLPYATSGNNGKGTFCELLRQMLGSAVCANISIKNLSKDFHTTSLLTACAVITDENDVGTYLDSASTFKSLVTSDPIEINRKHKDVLRMSWNGFMVQCINELPRFRDKTDSLDRRLIVVPFENCFKEIERPYIKHQYLAREDVREFYLKLALENDISKLEEPEICIQAKAEFRFNNDPTYLFYVEEFGSYSEWDYYPNGFVYDHYKAWYLENYPEGKPSGKTIFTRRLIDILNADKERKFRVLRFQNAERPPADSMIGVEPAIIRYELKNWMNKGYHGSDAAKSANFSRDLRSRIFFVRFDMELIEGGE